MKTIDIFEYKRAKNKRDELEEMLKRFDSIADMLYNDIQYKGVWDLIQHLEEVRVGAYFEFYEWDEIVKQKDKNVEK